VLENDTPPGAHPQSKPKEVLANYDVSSMGAHHIPREAPQKVAWQDLFAGLRKAYT